MLPAANQGFEPRSPGSDPGILPLDELAKGGNIPSADAADLHFARASDRLLICLQNIPGQRKGFLSGKGCKNITNVRSAEEVTRDILSWWNGSYFPPDEVVFEVKQIDRRYSGAAVR